LARGVELLVVADVAVVLAHHLLGQLHGLAFVLVELLVPPAVLVGRAEGVDDHERALVVHAELLLAVDVDEAARFGVARDALVDLEDGGLEVLELRLGEAAELERLALGEQAVGGLQLGGELDVRARELLAVLGGVPLGEAKLLGGGLAGLHAGVHGAREVVPADDLQRDEERDGLGRDLRRIMDDAQALDQHLVVVLEPEEVRVEAERLRLLEPVGRGAAEGLALLGDQRRDDLVEDRDLVGEVEEQLVLAEGVDLLHLALVQELHRAVPLGRAAGGRSLGFWPAPLIRPPRAATSWPAASSSRSKASTAAASPPRCAPWRRPFAGAASW